MSKKTRANFIAVERLRKENALLENRSRGWPGFWMSFAISETAVIAGLTTIARMATSMRASMFPALRIFPEKWRRSSHEQKNTGQLHCG